MRDIEKMRELFVISCDNDFAEIAFVDLHGNGRVFARREILRQCKKLHLDGFPFKCMNDVIYVRIKSHKDARKVAELWKYIQGSRFLSRCYNNGYFKGRVDFTLP